MYTDNGQYEFIRPEVKPGTLVSGHVYLRNLSKFVFAPKICVECDLSGFSERPDYWIDME
jgi:hypothetical protein